MFRSKSARDILLETLNKRGIGAEEAYFAAISARTSSARQNLSSRSLIDPWLSIDDGLHSASWYGALNRS